MLFVYWNYFDCQIRRFGLFGLSPLLPCSISMWPKPSLLIPMNSIMLCIDRSTFTLESRHGFSDKIKSPSYLYCLNACPISSREASGQMNAISIFYFSSGESSYVTLSNSSMNLAPAKLRSLYPLLFQRRFS